MYFYLYLKKLNRHDENSFIVWKGSMGISVSYEKDAAAGEIRTSKGKSIFAMNRRETIVNIDKAGALKAPLVDAMGESGIVDESVDYAPGVIGLVAYVLLVLGAGLFYVITNDAWILYAFIAGAVISTVSGVGLMALSSQEGKGKWSVPAMFLLLLGMVPTVPVSLLVKPLVRDLRRGKLVRIVKECKGPASRPTSQPV